MATPQAVRWVFVTRPHRCQQCGEMCLAVWLCYTEPGVWTLCYCEPCVGSLIGGDVQ